MPRQERRSKEILLASLGGVSPKELAQGGGLSVGHFSQRFPVYVGSDAAAGAHRAAHRAIQSCVMAGYRFQM